MVPPKTLYNRFVRCSRMGAFARIFVELAQPGSDGEIIVIDSTHLKVHRTAASLSKGGFGRERSDARRAHWTPSCTWRATGWEGL